MTAGINMAENDIFYIFMRKNIPEEDKKKLEDQINLSQISDEMKQKLIKCLRG